MIDSPETPARTRHDGWTGERRRDFLDTLAKVGNVRDACRTIGLSKQAAYKLRARDAGFAADWDAAQKRAATSLEAVAYARAVEGVEEPIFHGGVQVGTRRKTSDALLRLLLQAADPDKYGCTARGSPVQLREAMEKELEARIQEIEHEAYNRAYAAMVAEYDFGIEDQLMKNYLMRKLSIMHTRMCQNPQCRECRPDRADIIYWVGGDCDYTTHYGPDHRPIEAPQIWFNQAKVDLMLERIKAQREGRQLDFGPMPEMRTRKRHDERMKALAEMAEREGKAEAFKRRPERPFEDRALEAAQAEGLPSWRTYD